MLMWAGLAAGGVVGLWLLTWVVRIAAVAMYGVAALVLLAARIARGAQAVATRAGRALFAPPDMRRGLRRRLAQGWAARRGGPPVRLA